MNILLKWLQFLKLLLPLNSKRDLDTNKTTPSIEVFNLRSGVPYSFCRGGKVLLIQFVDDYLSVASPESGLISDCSRNKKVLRTEP